MISRIPLSVILASVGAAHAQFIPGDPAADWLVNPAPYKARISENKSAGDLVLENGLARRVIRLGPNAATITLQNLVSGEHLIRAVSPEARVTLNGTDYPIGGLAGQKIQNYVKEDWIKGLRPLPGAYQFSRWEEQPVSKRFEWKKRPEWLAKDHPWPPPGKHVVMHYDPPAAPARNLSGPALFEEKFGGFAAPKAGWTITASKANARSSFANEGKAGEIMALPDTSVFAERDWPQGAASVELMLDAGDDTISNAWGPGLAISAADGSTVNFIIRPNQQVFESPAGLAGKFDRSKPVKLRATLGEGTVTLEAAQDPAAFETIATIPFPKPPAKLRIGKVGRDGKGGDYQGGDINANLVRCHLLELAVRGKDPAAKPVPRGDLPGIDVHYELYDGIPVFSKWLVVRNDTGAATVRVNRFVSEELRLFEAEARGGDCHGPGSERERPNLYVETDMAFGGRMYGTADNHAVKLDGDPLYNTHVNYMYAPPTLLTVAPRAFAKGDGNLDPLGKQDTLLGPDADVARGASFESFRAFELLLDSDDRERRTLAQRRMYRVIAPWTNENPLMFHKIQSDPKTIREAIDQAAEAGFEMVIMSFSSGFNFESHDPKYWDTYKELADYGRSKGIALGGYSLLASRGAGDGTNTKGPTQFGVMPCLGAKWGKDYLDNIVAFSKYAGLTVFENDGSYPGDTCAATDHPFHHGYEDSQWVMWRAIAGQYQALKGQGVFLNIPDWYFLAGSNKCAMGYRETNWSLPRAEQEIIERQCMFDGTWGKTQSMGWMFVPLSQYHGGGAEATIEPLKEHLPHYEARFANLLGYGVQACYRGPRLFDSDETKALVKKWVSFYKQHRDVLDNGELIHLRRANGRDWDGILHANPAGKEKGLACFYNPLTEEVSRKIRIPLHYTGLTQSARISVDGDEPKTVTLTPDNEAEITVRIPAQGRTFLLFTE